MDFFGERSETKKIEGKSETEVMEVIRNELGVLVNQVHLILLREFKANILGD